MVKGYSKPRQHSSSHKTHSGKHTVWLNIGIALAVIIILVLTFYSAIRIRPVGKAGEAGTFSLSSCKQGGWVEGATYILQNDILNPSSFSADKKCFVIDTKDVLLDCKNYEVKGDYPASGGESIGAHLLAEGIMIQNCEMYDFRIGISGNQKNSFLKNNTLRNNAHKGIAVGGSLGSNIKVVENVIYNNAVGLQLEPGASDIIIAKNKAIHNTQLDLNYSCGSTHCLGNSGEGNMFSTMLLGDGSVTDDWPVFGDD